MTAIDPETLEELRGMVGDRFAAIIQSYLNNAAGFMDKIFAAAASGDAAAVQKTAHAFRSVSGQVGALKLQSYLAELDEMMPYDPPKAQAILPELRKAFDAATAELQALIASR